MAIKRVLLINPPWHRMLGGELAFTPLGLCYIAGILEQSGFKVSVYNADYSGGAGLLSYGRKTEGYQDYLRVLEDTSDPIWKEVETVLSEESPDIVGISVLTSKYDSAIVVSQLVKKLNKNLPVVWGGVHPTLKAEECLQNPYVDIVVRGEGEYTFLELVQNNAEQLDSILGISYKKNEQIVRNPDRPLITELDTIPFPARHLLRSGEKHRPEALGNIFASRGCPYQCIFCASHKIWTRQVRYRSPQNVVDEMKYLKENFKVRHFRFEDDSFTINRKFVSEVCRLLRDEELNVEWECETRADLITDDLVKEMKAAGCVCVFIGVESGSPATLQKIKKGITIDNILNAKDILHKNGMLFHAFFMIGFPWETRRDIQDTVSLMNALDPHFAAFNVATPYPETELFGICDSEGMIPQNLSWGSFYHQSPEMYFTKKLERGEVRQIIEETERLFDIHNRRKKRELLMSRPLYVIGRAVRGGYFNPGDLWQLLRRWVWE